MADVNKMIWILLNKNGEEGERDDAAMDLANYDSSKVLNALKQVASDPHEDEMISSSCGESLGEILVKFEQLKWEYLSLITPNAYAEAYAIIKKQRPEWIEEVLKS